jgi:hypothetical protein
MMPSALPTLRPLSFMRQLTRESTAALPITRIYATESRQHAVAKNSHSLGGLPAGGAIQESLQAWLAAPPSKEFWSDSELKQGFVDGSLEALRHLGVPQVLLPVLRGLHRVSSAMRRIASRVTRRWSGPAADQRIRR